MDSDRPWRDEDDDLPADAQPEEVAALPETQPSELPPDEGDEEPEGLIEDLEEVEPEEQAAERAPATGSVSGLAKQQRLEARRIAIQAAVLGFNNAPAVHYTQHWQKRWEGIAKALLASKGQFPKNADCSSFVTWCLWNALKVRFGIRDTVNGQNWKAGYTGTMHDNGKRVVHRENWLLGDLVLYGVVGRPGTHHVAIHAGDGWVISHGSEGGPYKIRWDYRGDVLAVRRFI